MKKRILGITAVVAAVMVVMMLAGCLATPATALPDPAPATPVEPAEPAPVLAEYQIGDAGPAGGIIFYDKGNFSDGWRYLEAAPADVDPAEWGSYGTTIGGISTVVGSGKRNTHVIGDWLRGKGESGRAAQICTQYRGGNMDDWFLPSKDELNLMYDNLALKVLGDFGAGYYWSSSEGYDDSAWAQRFSDGSQSNYNYKNNSYAVRPVRAF
jgi:hypothetical protein